MKKLAASIFLSGVMIFAAGCIFSQPHPQLDNSFIGTPLKPYQGPKARIFVNEFEIKTSAAEKDTVAALRDIFLANLNKSKRFTSASLKEADLIIEVAVVDFTPLPCGGKSGVAGGGSSGSSFMGGLLGTTLNKASMGWDVRVIDQAKAEVISKKNIRFQSQGVKSAGEDNFLKDFAQKEVISKYKLEPMGKVIYNCVTESVRYLAQNIPLSYYKYN